MAVYQTTKSITFKLQIDGRKKNASGKKLTLFPKTNGKYLAQHFMKSKLDFFTPEHIAKKVSPTGLLTAEEQTKLYQLIYIDP